MWSSLVLSVFAALVTARSLPREVTIGFQNDSIVAPAGYRLMDGPMNKAINAPYDSQGYNTLMGTNVFTKGAFSAQLCADYCASQTAYNVKHPARDGTPPKACHFFNTYMMYLNDLGNPQGQYCVLYTEAWDANLYATNGGQYRGKDHYFVDQSYTFVNTTSAGPAPVSGDMDGAVYQARQDMTYFASSLASTFLPFCTSLIGQGVKPTITPGVLNKYPATVLSSGCSMIATVAASSRSSSTSSTTPPAAPDAYDVITSLGLQPFCSDLLQYPVPISTATRMLITTVLTTRTNIVTETTSTTESFVSTVSDLVIITASATVTTSIPAIQKRQQSSLATPSALSGYAAGSVVSVCSRIVSPPQATTTTVQATQTASSTLDVLTTTTTTAISTTLSTITLLSSSTTTSISTITTTLLPSPTSFALLGNGKSTDYAWNLYLYAYSSSQRYSPAGVATRDRATVFTISPQGFFTYTNPKGIDYILVAQKGYAAIEVNVGWYKPSDAVKAGYKVVTCDPFVLGSMIVCAVEGKRLWFDYLSSGIEASWSEKAFALTAVL